LNQMWTWHCPYSSSLAGRAIPDCVFGKPWDQATTRALLWGDSHAEHMAPLVEVAAEDLPASFMLYLPCPAAFGGDVHRIDNTLPNYVDLCIKTRKTGIQLLRDHPEINLVIFASPWTNLPRLITPANVRFDRDEALARLAGGIEDLIDETAAPGRRFII